MCVCKFFGTEADFLGGCSPSTCSASTNANTRPCVRIGNRPPCAAKSSSPGRSSDSSASKRPSDYRQRGAASPNTGRLRTRCCGGPRRLRRRWITPSHPRSPPEPILDVFIPRNRPLFSFNVSVRVGREIRGGRESVVTLIAVEFQTSDSEVARAFCPRV